MTPEGLNKGGFVGKFESRRLLRMQFFSLPSQILRQNNYLKKQPKKFLSLFISSCFAVTDYPAVEFISDEQKMWMICLFSKYNLIVYAD